MESLPLEQFATSLRRQGSNRPSILHSSDWVMLAGGGGGGVWGLVQRCRSFSCIVSLCSMSEVR